VKNLLRYFGGEVFTIVEMLQPSLVVFKVSNKRHVTQVFGRRVREEEKREVYRNKGKRRNLNIFCSTR
jgi:hypothetical protein